MSPAEKHNELSRLILRKITWETDDLAASLVVLESVVLGMMLLTKNGAEYLDVMTERVVQRLNLDEARP